MAIEPIFSGAQLAANVITTQQLQRGTADAAPVQVAQAVQLQSMAHQYDDAADRVQFELTDVGSTPTYDVHARVEPTPGSGQGRGQLFDSRA
jgi:hypothetical protein